jgi:hypothetical protein
MKHLKNYKIFGSSLMMKLSKEELDKLDRSDFEDYRSEFINRNRQELDFNQYMNELNLYIEIRFEDNKKFLENLIKKEKEGNLSKYELDRKSQELILSVIKKDGGLDFMNNGILDDMRKIVGNPKYILGL